MSVDADTVREIASLARLAVSEDRIEIVAEEMSSILDFMGAIAQWEGEASAETPATIRRDDTPIETENSSLIDAAAHVHQGTVIVPPIKDAS